MTQHKYLYAMLDAKQNLKLKDYNKHNGMNTHDLLSPQTLRCFSSIITK